MMFHVEQRKTMHRQQNEQKIPDGITASIVVILESFRSAAKALDLMPPDSPGVCELLTALRGMSAGMENLVEFLEEKPELLQDVYPIFDKFLNESYEDSAQAEFEFSEELEER